MNRQSDKIRGWVGGWVGRAYQAGGGIEPMVHDVLKPIELSGDRESSGVEVEIRGGEGDVGSEWVGGWVGGLRVGGGERGCSNELLKWFEWVEENEAVRMS